MGTPVVHERLYAIEAQQGDNQKSGEGSLAGGLSRAIHIEDQPMGPLSIPKSSCFLQMCPVGEPGDLSKRGRAEPQLWPGRTPEDCVSASSGEVGDHVQQDHELVGKRLHAL